MATNFPNSPSNGATHVFGGTTYTYNSTKGVWKAGAEAIAVGDNPPSNPDTGDLWFDSSVAKTYIYYNDGSSSQWVQLNPSGGSDGADGTDGTDATGGGESPVILTEPPTTTQSLNSDGTTSTVTMTAQDPEGFDITYGIAYKTANNARPVQLSADTSINQTTGVYTFTPTTTSSNAGSFRARLSASDGVNTTTRLVDFSLSFFSGSYLVAGDGTQVVGTGGGTTVHNATTATDAALTYDAGVIDANYERILFTGMPAFSLTPTSGTDDMLVYAVKYDTPSGTNIGYSAVDDNSYHTGSVTLNSSSIGWSLGTASTYYASNPQFSPGSWYIIAITSTGTGVSNFSSRVYDVTNQTFSTVTGTSAGGYAMPYLPVDGTYDNHMAFFGGLAQSPITGYIQRDTMGHQVAGVAVMPYNSSTVDSSITQFKDLIFA